MCVFVRVASGSCLPWSQPPSTLPVPFPLSLPIPKGGQSHTSHHTVVSFLMRFSLPGPGTKNKFVGYLHPLVRGGRRTEEGARHRSDPRSIHSEIVFSDFRVVTGPLNV